MKNALIITNRQNLAQDLRTELESQNWQTVVSNSVSPAQKLLQKTPFRLVVLDGEHLSEGGIQLESPSSGNGFLLLVQNPDNHQIPSDLSPDALLDDPFDPRQLWDTLAHLEGRHQKMHDMPILGRSEAIQQIRTTIAQIAPTSVTVLITGESGSGKNIVAEAIHRASTRSTKRFLTLNCGAIPETLLESELFGHERGAFTDARETRKGHFEMASGGTLFLDEIGEMSLSAQVRLLRVLEAREVTRLGSTTPIPIDVRVIAATNRNLPTAVAEKKFRLDLYHRLRVIEISVPSLREHPEDIPILLDRFIEQTAKEQNLPAIELTPDALHLLPQYHWPGNIRELRNLVERLMVLSPSRILTASDLRTHIEALGLPSPNTVSSNLPIHLGTTQAESDRDLLYWAILEVARDIKELKAFLMNRTLGPPSLPVHPPEETPIAPQGMAIEYEESPSEEGIKPLREIEREAIIKALRATNGHRKKAADLLGMAERTLYRKIQDYNL